jgi:uncharacterized membrane protein
MYINVSQHRDLIKTLTFAAMHFTVAFLVTWGLTGDILIGSLVAMVEPAVNTVAFYFHEKMWSPSKGNARALHFQPLR